VLPYESTRELERAAWTKRPDRRAQPHVLAPSWRRYGAVVRVERDVIVIGDDRDEIARTAELVARPGDSDPFSIAALGPGEPDALHAERIRKTIELILEGDVYLVNIARRFDFEVRGRPVDLVARLAAHARAPFAAALQWDDVALAASSPELFLDVAADGRLATAPIKGTRPRGADAREDSRLVRELAQDPKEIAELTMVVDVERNDLGRIAEIGSVRLRGDPVVRSFGPVHHRIATVTARLRAGVSRAGLLESMLPSGSVTGAPKVRAMEIIADLESARRGLYTGAFGYVSHEGAMRLGMAIRTLTIQDGIGHYFAGGGIVVGSDPDREVLETRWKASQMGRLLERIPRDA
jgi:anthranilate/para-aminobenzoate synthase component I